MKLKTSESGFLLPLIVFSRTTVDHSQSWASTLESGPTLAVRLLWSEKIIFTCLKVNAWGYTRTHARTHCTGTLQKRRDDRTIWLHLLKGVPRLPSCPILAIAPQEWMKSAEFPSQPLSLPAFVLAVMHVCSALARCTSCLVFQENSSEWLYFYTDLTGRMSLIKEPSQMPTHSAYTV